MTYNESSKDPDAQVWGIRCPGSFTCVLWLVEVHLGCVGFPPALDALLALAQMTIELGHQRCWHVTSPSAASDRAMARSLFRSVCLR
jgi:hypothetical protein